jgi:glycosyltransferase involved in cell wall biosynthesis
MTVVYYMQVCFLDVAIELVNVLKKYVDLHVLIEITPHGKNMTILEVENIPMDKTLVHPSELLTQQSYQYLQTYFKGVASVHFVVHPHRTGFSYSTLQTNFRVWKYIKQFKPDVIHFETVGLRAIGMLPFLKAFKNVCITIHDPVPHTGESTWKLTLPRTFFFNMPVNTRFFFYSKFAKEQFERHYKKIKKPKQVLYMSPYGYLRQLVGNSASEKKHILFFGRLSPYKGIDTLLQAMPAVLQEYPNEQLVIAGKKNPGFELDEAIIGKYSNNITLIEKHIPNEVLAQLIQEAKFIVCPYKDATQSGVLMTAFGLQTPVIATDVGSFPEFIENNVNGLLVHSDDPKELSDCIRFALRNDHYQVWRQHIIDARPDEQWGRNKEILLETYAGGFK